MAKNGISTLPTKEARQIAKLELAQTKRQQTGTPGYRENRYYDLDLLPTKYVGDDVVNTPNVGGLQAGRPWKTTPNILSGLWRSVYDGYWIGGGPVWFDSQTPVSSGAVTTIELELGVPAYTSYQWLGYFRAPNTANYIFTAAGDDSSALWIGSKAITAYTIDNADIFNSDNNDTVSAPIALTAGQYYPIRVIYGNGPSGGYFELSWEDDSPTYTIMIEALDEGSFWSFAFVGSYIPVGNYYYTTSNTTDIESPSGLLATVTEITAITIFSREARIITDGITEGPETFTLSVRFGSVTGPILATSEPVTIIDSSNTLPPTYVITPEANNVDEGSTLTVSVATTNVPSVITTLYWTVSESSDFVESSGSFGLAWDDTSNGTYNVGSFELTPTADAATEGSQTFTVSIRTGSVSGPVVATSNPITINDTSLTPAPTYTLTALGSQASGTSVDEGWGATFEVGGTNIADGTYYWTIGTNASDFTTASGSFDINNNTGSFVVTPTADTTTEGAETFTVSIRSVSITGTVLATSDPFTINDTSLTPGTPEPVTQDLILFFDSERTDCYPGTGTAIYNLVDNTASTLFGNVTYNDGVLRIFNTETAVPTNRVSGIQCQTVTGFKTISLWYKQKTSSAGYYSYIVDARNGMPGGWVYDTPSDDYFGPDWAVGTMFINGGASQQPNYTQQLNVWRNVTFVTDGTAFTDDITLFSRNNQIEGLDIEFGACMIYSRTITQSENQQNYNQFKTRYELSTYESVDPTGQTITITKKYPFKITVRSTSYEVTPFVNAQISIDDTLVVNTAGRGHTVLALTSTGTVISQTRYDTWDPYSSGLTDMNTALLGLPTGTVIAICTYDATSFNATVRSTLNTYYGGTLTDTWGSVIPRYSHIFIGQKI